MKNCLITGCNGFIGSHLAEFLVNKGLTVYGTVHSSRERVASLGDKIAIFECDISDKERVKEIVSYVKPDLIFHLAAQSKVAKSWQDPEQTFKINVLGTLYLLDSIKIEDIDPVVVVVGAAAIYGSSIDNAPIRENQGFRTSSPYAISKVAQDMLAGLYWQAYGMNVIRIRPFNITGPSMIGDACSDFANGIVEIERGLRNVLHAGNLNSIRDITDVRDALEALWRIANRGSPGAVYNLCSGIGYHIGDLLNKMINMSKVKVNLVQDDLKKRVLEDPFQIGDNSKLRDLGWRPMIPIEKTLSDMLDYYRRHA